MASLLYKIKELYDVVVTKASISKPVIIGLKERKVAMATNVINIELGNAFIRTDITGSQTFSVINASAVEDDAVVTFILSIATVGATSVTWWAGIKWTAGSIPQLTANGRDTFAFISYDKGTTWDGYVMSKDSK